MDEGTWNVIPQVMDVLSKCIRPTHTVKDMPCPECEGTGCSVNYFDPPPARYDGLMARPDVFIDRTPRRSDGREFHKDSPCQCCNGRGHALMVVPIT